jgi:hypothetical protein
MAKFKTAQDVHNFIQALSEPQENGIVNIN